MIYLDNAATTPCAESVLQAMLPFFRESYGNASSIDHVLGSKARDAVERARTQVADLLGAKPEEVVFTSGSTEANNLALSVALPVSTTQVEHPSVLDSLKARNRDDDMFLATDEDGVVAFESLTSALRSARRLISVIATNNETGVEQDLDLLAKTVNEAGSLLHIDATQAVGTSTIDFRNRQIAACSISAHKIYGPKGVGALVVSGVMRRNLTPMIRGGGHERGMRSGTLNVPGIVGFGAAAEIAMRERRARRAKLQVLSDLFYTTITKRTNGLVAKTVCDAQTSPHILSLRLRGINSRALLRAVRDDVAFSLGSACATNKSEPSHVLTALGRDKPSISETIRCSFSAYQTEDDVLFAAIRIADAAISLAEFSLPA